MGVIVMISKEFLGGCTAEVVPVIGENYYKTLNWAIKRCKNTIDLTIFTTSINTGNSYHKIHKLLLNIGHKIKKEKITARAVVFRGSKNNKIGRKNERFAAEAEKNKIKVRLCSAGTFLHSKVIIIDQRYILLGSHNFSSSSMSKHHEASILLESAKLAGVYQNYFDDIWNKAQ